MWKLAFICSFYPRISMKMFILLNLDNYVTQIVK